MRFPDRLQQQQEFQNQESSICCLKLTYTTSSLAEQDHWLGLANHELCLLLSPLKCQWATLELLPTIPGRQGQRALSTVTVGGAVTQYLAQAWKTGQNSSLEGLDQVNLHPVRFLDRNTLLTWFCRQAKPLVGMTTWRCQHELWWAKIPLLVFASPSPLLYSSQIPRDQILRSSYNPHGESRDFQKLTCNAGGIWLPTLGSLSPLGQMEAPKTSLRRSYASLFWDRTTQLT